MSELCGSGEELVWLGKGNCKKEEKEVSFLKVSSILKNYYRI